MDSLVGQSVVVIHRQLVHSFLSKGTFPFPGQNVASPKHGGSCTSNAASNYRCDRVVDGEKATRSHVNGPSMTIVFTFNQVYVVNKVLFHGHQHEQNLTMKFSDGTTEKVKFN